MPRIEELIDTIGPAGVITTLDLAKGYWQIPVDEESKDKTAFTTPFRLCEFEVMPFGLHSAQQKICFVLATITLLSVKHALPFRLV